VAVIVDVGHVDHEEIGPEFPDDVAGVIDIESSLE
jgi:hypothetical protein